MRRPTAVVVANEANPLAALGVPEQGRDKPQPAHPPFLEPPLVEISLLLQSVGFVNDDAQPAVSGDVNDPVAASDGVDFVVRNPALIAKVLVLPVDGPDGAARRSHPE